MNRPAAERPRLTIGAHGLFLLALLAPAPVLAQSAPATPEAPASKPDSAVEPAPIPAENTDVQDIAPPREGSTSPEPSKRPLSRISRSVTNLEKRTGVKLGLAYTTLFQQASGGPNARQAAGGDVDFSFKWTALGRDTKDTGQLVMNAEYRHEMGAITPSQLGGEIGALNGTTNSFGIRPIVVKELYWTQRLRGDTLRYAVGRVDTDGLLAGHALQSANTSFLNKAFSTSPTIPVPGAGATFGLRFLPNGRFTGMIAGVNARAVTTQMNLDDLFEEGDVLTYGELGWQPKLNGTDQGRYRIAAWHVPKLDAKPEDWGVTIIAEQDFGSRVTTFGRLGWSDEGTGSVQEYAEGGTGWKDLFGRKGDLLGAAAAWTSAADPALRDEKVTEVFQRFNFGGNLNLTISAQLILEPARAPDDDTLGVFSARLRFWF